MLVTARTVLVTARTVESKLKGLMVASVAGPFLCCKSIVISMDVLGSVRTFPCMVRNDE